MQLAGTRDWRLAASPTTMCPMTALLIAGLVILVVLALVILVVLRKGRPMAGGDVFRASRWSKGNHLFPTQVRVTPTSVVHYTPQWIGRLEHTIHIAHVASVRIDTKLLFSDVFIETSGGVSPISCYGHHKKDAVKIKDLIDQYQSEYFKGPVPPVSSVPARN
jgi:hypothetical protein